MVAVQEWVQAVPLCSPLYARTDSELGPIATLDSATVQSNKRQLTLEDLFGTFHLSNALLCRGSFSSLTRPPQGLQGCFAAAYGRRSGCMTYYFASVTLWLLLVQKSIHSALCRAPSTPPAKDSSDDVPHVRKSGQSLPRLLIAAVLFPVRAKSASCQVTSASEWLSLILLHHIVDR